MSEPITKICYGRERTYDPAVKRWRNRLRLYRTRKARLMAFLLSVHPTPQAAAEWLKSPNSALGGKAPKVLVKPVGILKLLQFAEKTLKKPSP